MAEDLWFLLDLVWSFTLKFFCFKEYIPMVRNGWHLFSVSKTLNSGGFTDMLN